MVRAANCTVDGQGSIPVGERRVTLHYVNWQGYRQILQALPQTRAAHLTFDRGTLEIVMPLEDHE